MKTFEYKGYIGSIEFNQQDNIYHGKLINVNGLISYHGNTLEDLENDFKDSVDMYTELLKERESKKTYLS